MQASITIYLAGTNLDKADILSSQLSDNSLYHCKQFNTEKELFPALTRSCPQLFIYDLTCQGQESRLKLLKKIRSSFPDLLIIAIIPEGADDLVEQILRLNLFFYIHYPFDPAEIRIALKRAQAKINSRPNKPSPPSRSKAESPESFYGLIGQSPRMRQLFDLIARIAEDEFATVLIRGESGTGKELVAKAIHAHSKRNKNHFVPVNCAAIPDDLLESELFGYTKGAFTGATQNKTGRIEYADGGTLFLDEIGDMKPSLQAKLLRVLQEKEFEPVGGLKACPVDTRIVAATHCDLEQLVSEGKFREDLYYRLSVIPLTIPPLKERREDIPLLLNSFIHHYSTLRGREPLIFTADVIQALTQHEWRGNVRELENLVQHMSILYSGKTVLLEDLPEKYTTGFDPSIHMEIQSHPVLSDDSSPLIEAAESSDFLSDPALLWEGGEIDFNELINAFECKLIILAMKMTSGNKKEAARLLNLKRTTLLEKMKKKELLDIWEE